ncbi:mucin-2 [Uranotaenia lowii]|uniref:mucin-2 n=1 Tax=Uranotaenia lowii TaxID=190385 RepID=UPI0024786952|nr:mucin-2 [Uranotaenia lowii]
MLLRLLSIYGCLNMASAGYVSVQLPYMNPAGINYVSGQTHLQSGLVAGPVAAARYPATVSHHGVQVVGSPSYYSYNLPNPLYGYGAGHVTPVVYGAASKPSVVTVAHQPVQPVHTVQSVHPVTVAHQPVHPVVTQVHTATVQPVHVQTATAIPVHYPVSTIATPVSTTFTKVYTREEDSVSTHTESPLPVIKSRRYKVRRPAIQNHFYDIEERVIIRPVGSALVELEQPISKTETGVKTHVVQSSSEPGIHDVGQGHFVTTKTSVTPKPPFIIYQQTPVHQVPVVTPSIVTTKTSVTPKPPFIIYHQTPVHQVPVVTPNPVIVHASNTGHVLHQPVPVVPQVQTPVYVNHAHPVYVHVDNVPTNTAVSTVKPVYASTVPTTSYPTTTESSYDYDDSVVVEARSGDRTVHEVTSTEGPAKLYSANNTRSQQSLKPTRCDEVLLDELPNRGDITITYATRATHQNQEYENENITDSTDSTEEPAIPSSTSNSLNVESKTTSNVSTQSQEIKVETRQQTKSKSNIEFSDEVSDRIIISNNGSPEEARSNQEQFIRLLSERDSISEVGLGPKGETSSSLINAYVRSRVLLATPAPLGSKESSRTVNIRRIIVSRPVETEQEVEVREQAYPSYGFGHQVASSTEQVPVYTPSKPPAFADDDSK